MFNKARLKDIFNDISTGKMSVAEAIKNCEIEENLGFAKIDHDRERRCGFPEVIFAEFKTTEHSLAIAESLLNKTGFAFLTRVPEQTKELILSKWPDADYNKLSKTIILGKLPDIHKNAKEHNVLVISAGTSDIPVAEEAAVTARVMGCNVEYLHDAGVAGIHRILGAEPQLKKASVIIVTAGMEGALPSVVAGLVDCPVIGVPTSIGYGASFKGIAALLGMLNSCANGVAVVNIDNGFGAGCLAARIIKKVKEN